VTVRMLYLIFIRSGWMVLLARSAASKDAELLVLPPGSRNTAAAESQPEAGLGRPGGDRGPGLTAPRVVTEEPTGSAGNVADLSPAVSSLAVDLSLKGRSATGCCPARRVDRADGTREPRAGATGGSKVSCSAWASGSAPPRYGGS